MRSKPIDPRGPRFGATITSVALLVVIWLAIPSATHPRIDAAWWTLVAITALFAWGAILGPSRHPYGWLFRFAIRPFLGAPEFLEEQAPPRFAQAVGLFVSLIGVVVHLIGVPYALVVAASAAFIAAFLNAAFGLCLGCEIYAALPTRTRSSST
jgi:hypothetical protein